MKIVAISGSLRKASCNQGLLRAVGKSLPAGTTFDILVPDLPLFNSDLKTLPQEVKEFRQKLKGADGFIFGTSEYNYSLSGALKNALDWGSRGDDDGNLFAKKAGGVIGAGGASGSLRAQNHLRDIAVYLDLRMLNHPQIQVNIFTNPSPFNLQNGDVTDTNVLSQCENFSKVFVDWTQKNKKIE